jgi:hypothetical protein
MGMPERCPEATTPSMCCSCDRGSCRAVRSQQHGAESVQFKGHSPVLQGRPWPNPLIHPVESIHSWHSGSSQHAWRQD